MNRRKIKTGRIVSKRFDTRIGTIEKQYKVDFNVRADMKLGSYLKKKGFPSLSKALDKIEKQVKK